jgi:hypothetical protein
MKEKKITTAQATSLNAALDNFNELQPLVFNTAEAEASPSANPAFYVERPDNPLDELKAHLINSRLHEKILLTGHLGSGKSTELNRLAANAEIQRRFFVVKYSIRDVVNIIDIDYVDFLLSFAALLFTRAYEAKIKFQPTLLSKIVSWIDFAKSGENIPRDLNGGRGNLQKAYNFFKRIVTILVREITLREAMRKSVQRNLSELVEVINLTIDQIQTSLPSGKELLVIIDDLEKIPDIERADRLFNQAGSYLVQPRCKIVFTLPIFLYYSLNIKPLTDTFGGTYFLRNIKLMDRHTAQPIEAGYTLMRAFLQKRLALGLIEPPALETAIACSGGVVREMVRVTKDAVIKALSKGRSTITQDLIDLVIIELRNEYSRGLVARHYTVLQNILNNQPTDDAQTLMELYHTRVLLEYEDDQGERWNAVHPIVKPLLDKFQKGLR